MNIKQPLLNETRRHWYEDNLGPDRETGSVTILGEITIYRDKKKLKTNHPDILSRTTKTERVFILTSQSM